MIYGPVQILINGKYVTDNLHSFCMLGEVMWMNFYFSLYAFFGCFYIHMSVLWLCDLWMTTKTKAITYCHSNNYGFLWILASRKPKKKPNSKSHPISAGRNPLCISDDFRFWASACQMGFVIWLLFRLPPCQYSKESIRFWNYYHSPKSWCKTNEARVW